MESGASQWWGDDFQSFKIYLVKKYNLINKYEKKSIENEPWASCVNFVFIFHNSFYYRVIGHVFKLAAS